MRKSASLLWVTGIIHINLVLCLGLLMLVSVCFGRRIEGVDILVMGLWFVRRRNVYIH